MSSPRKFTAPWSPLNGKRVPMDWQCMEPSAKGRALVAYGYAQDYKAARKMIGRHAAAVVRQRRIREADERKQELERKRRSGE